MSVVEKIGVEIEHLSPAEGARLSSKLAEKQMKSLVIAEGLLDSDEYFCYRDLASAICNSVMVDARLILESDTFEDFLKRTVATLVVRDPFPNPIPGSASIVLFESYVAGATMQIASYVVLSDKNVIMNPTAREMFGQMHKHLLTASSCGSGFSATTNTNA